MLSIAKLDAGSCGLLVDGLIVKLPWYFFETIITSTLGRSFFRNNVAFIDPDTPAHCIICSCFESSQHHPFEEVALSKEEDHDHRQHH